jgi:hypothetical protein
LPGIATCTTGQTAGSGDLRRFTEIFGTIGLSATGEAIVFGLTGDPGDLVILSVAAQHAEMPVMICSTGAFRLIFHCGPTFHLCDPAGKSVPIIAGNVLKENV